MKLNSKITVILTISFFVIASVFITASLTALGRNQTDNLSLFKNIPIYREASLEARFDAFNMTNTPAFANPTSSFTSGSFGKITSILGSGVGNVNGVGGPRVLQAAVKFTF